jgi:hypothetical protein
MANPQSTLDVNGSIRIRDFQNAGQIYSNELGQLYVAEETPPTPPTLPYHITDASAEILFDSSIINFSQLYLNSYPVIDNVSAWWSFPSEQPDKNAAQWWHFDLDRPKWLKFFFFLTDCSIENGAHSFVRGSHKNNGIPWSLRKKGYERLNDNDVEKNFPKKDIIDIVATKGSLLIEDTRGLHKGRHLIKNNRFLIQVQYSSSLFGGVVKNFTTPKLNSHTKETIREYEYTYSLFK